jgi:predicted RNA binding protein YcfA (HicA-like mRNA interferase family)
VARRSFVHGLPNRKEVLVASRWPATKARRVLAALLRAGWRIKRRSGSHLTLAREGWPDVVFASHDDEEIGPRMLARLARTTFSAFHPTPPPPPTPRA